MKQIITTALFLAILLFAQTTIVANRCNQNTPHWGESLGTISFATNETWIIGNQVWSDAVQTTVCSNRTTHNAGGYSADCRRNLGQKGDFFSACAIIRFANSLCPYPWRVPTIEDFLELDIAMGGTGDGVLYRDVKIRDNYLNIWGGTFSGSTFGHQGINATYWALSKDNIIGRLEYCNVGWIYINTSIRKDLFGFSLRCVRIVVDSVAILQDSIAKLHQQLSACNNQATAWQDSISNLNERLATYGSLNSLLNDSIGELHQQLIACSNQNSSLSDSISALNSRIATLLSDTALSHSDITELRDSINRLHEQLASQNCLLTALNDSIGNLHTQLTACNSLNSLLQDSIGTLNQAIVEWFEITENLLDSIDWLRQALVDCENSNNTNIVGEHVSSPLQVFPNPVTDKLHITHEWQSGDVVELFDMNGRRVFSAQPNNYQFTIDMTPFPNGTYILRIGNRVAKIVKR